MFDRTKFRSFDLETYLSHAGERTPRIVCGSLALEEPSGLVGQIFDREAAIAHARALLESDLILVGANIAAFDLLILAGEDPSLLPLIFRALAEGRVYDILLAQTLDSIAGGLVGLDPRTGQPLRNADNKPTTRHSLHTVVDLVLGRTDAKERDTFRKSYALFDDIPISAWPAEAKQYPIDDAVNTLEAAIRQVTGGFERGKFDPFDGPVRNLDNLPFQCESAFCLALGAAWGFRADGERVETLAREVERKHAEVIEHFKKFGFVRDDGSEDQVAVKRAVAVAYGATGKCQRCGGKGRVVTERQKEIPCRGEKVKGRFQGCLGIPCICQGKGVVVKIETGDATCKAADDGCDGTGLDLDSAPMLPRTDKGGISTSRDTLMESAEDELATYGADEFEKARTTYVPYLRKGVDRPLSYYPDALKATGRCGYDGSPIHQFPRDGGYFTKEGIYIPSVRECIRARDGYVIGSTDYEAGELCALAQFMYWVFGYSAMLDAINTSGKPGILHSEIAAETLGLSIDEFLKRLEAKDPQAKAFRQSSKPISFGEPAGMGAVKIVLTSRKKSAGETTLPNGTKVAGIRFCVLIGERPFCGEQKITEWKDRPCPPVCKACVEIVQHVLKVAYHKRFPEVRDYYQWVQERLDIDGRVPSLMWDWNEGKPVVERWRAGVDFSAACNNGFQSMLARVGKLALSWITRECYLGVTDEGNPSPLHGSRVPIWYHDEPMSEIVLARLAEAGPRIADLMVKAGKCVAPDVTWKAETAAAFYWNKGMEPVYNENNELVPWEPKKPKQAVAA